MAEHADQPLAVVDEYGVAVEEVVADQDHLARRGGLDGGAGADREVEARVGVALLAIEETAQAERAGEGAVHRFVEHQVAGLAGAEGLIGIGLLRQLAVDAHHVFGQRVDLAAVLQLDVLLAVVLVADLEAELAAIVQYQLMGAGRTLERDADDGYPVAAFFFDDQHGFVLIAGAGRLRLIPQRDDGDATGDGVIEQPTDETGLGREMSATQQQDEKEQATHYDSIE
ncbi:hypothetical protein D3C79_624150 [compost metagenome]